MIGEITIGDVCTGIGAAAVAFHSLGWRHVWMAEIEASPSLALAHHYPTVPNLGDMNLIPGLLRNGDILAPDVFCGGTPCQAFSVAGARRSLDDARGNLSLTFCEIADEIDIQRAATGLLPATVFWENVPGVLSTKDNAFGCFLGQLAGEDDAIVPPGGKWSNSGAVFGPQRAIAWRILDAQYFGLAQRRRRVFVVASARNGFDPAAVLFEFEGVRRDSAPRRGTGQEAAGTLSSRTDGGGFPGTDEACSGYVQPVAKTICAGGNSNNPLDETLVPVTLSVALRGREGGGTAELGDELANCLRASTGGGDKPHVLAPIAFSCKDYGNDATNDLAPTMRAMGHSGSHANAGGQLAVCIHADAIGRTGEAITPSADAEGRIRLRNPGMGIIDDGTVYNLMATGQPHAVCVTGEITHTLKAEGFDASEDGTGRGQPIVAAMAFQSTARPEASMELAYALRADSPTGGGQPQAVMTGMAVRRLTPRECEILQGFPAIRNEITIRLCLDHQKNSVDAVLSCRKWPTDALPAVAEKWMPSVPVAGTDSSTPQAILAPLAALRVRTSSADNLQEVHSHGRSVWFASSAAGSGQFPLLMPSGAIAAALAQASRGLDLEIMDGKAGSQLSIRLSMPAFSGEQNAPKSGAENVGYVSDAASDAQPAKFTTSDLGRAIPTSGSKAETWLCSALAAISSCIPSETLPENFSLILDVETPYTAIPLAERRNSARAGVRVMADGPRYKALGNSWAVPVVSWIGRRIDQHLRDLDAQKTKRTA